jgi:hypothetical protein
MRFALRAAAVSVLTALAAAVLLFRIGSEPFATAAEPAADVDLALVPADAAGFIHVRAADLWKNEVFASFRQTFEKAGPKALAALDAQFVPKISTFDRATAFLMVAGEHKRSVPVIVLQFSEPFDTAEVVTTYLPKATAEKVGGKTVYRSEHADFEIHFPDNRHIMLSDRDGMGVYLNHEMPKTGPMSTALKLAASGKPVVGSVNLSAIPIPGKVLEELPAEVKLLLKAEHITASLDLGANAKIELIAGYKNAEDAQAAEKAVKALAEYARKELAKVKADLEKKLLSAKGPRPLGELPEALLSVFALGAVNQLDDILAKPEEIVKRNGSDLVASVPLPKELVAAAGGVAAIGAGLLLPAVQKVRASAARMQSTNNLKQIALAVHNYHDTYGHFPQDIVDKNGKPLLSWRVAILPFIEQNNLYKQFKLDEPWDSEHNKPLSEVVVKTYTSPQANPPAPFGKTFYKGFAGPSTVFEPGKKIKLTDIFDGTSNTIMLVEAGEPIEWTRPGDIPFDPKKAPPKLALQGVDDIVLAAMCDGSVRALNMKKLTEKTLKDAIMRDDGNPLGDDW